ncbi:pantoate--beta-alanine ligase [Dermacoccaceae bacterium W4C1]
MPLQTVTTVRECRQVLAAARAGGGTVALVPTMGALHEGHAALVRHARQVADTVVVSIFVNPLQFGDAADLDRYPRTLDADTTLLASLGADFIFAPAASELYPRGEIATRVTAGPTAETFEGASRPGHFDGMLTVVAKLVNIVRPDLVCFGEKDAQQVFLVKQMLRDLDEPVTVDEVDTVREPDGLARSSRNIFLEGEQRTQALALSRALDAAVDAATAGVPAMLKAGRAILEDAPGVEPDYFEAVDLDTFTPAGDEHRGALRLIVAARVGDVRLIDTRFAVAG